MRTIDGDDDSYDKIDKDWSKSWRKDGYRHRDGDLPAVILADGTLIYYKYNKLHRDSRLPAVIWSDGTVEYWIEGKKQI